MMIAASVPTGAKIPCQTDTSAPFQAGTCDSGGTSGKAGDALVPKTP